MLDSKKRILFDGTSLNGWKSLSGQKPDWILADGAMTVNHDCLVSETEFADAFLHLEFKIPFMPNATGQNRGNSGVYLHGCYEVQVLDSYDAETPASNDCGAIYEMYAPLFNACKPPEEWQSYDIILKAPKYDEAGTIKEDGRLTLLQNGIPIHNNVTLWRSTPGGITKDRVPKGPLMLQDHGCPVSFRNIWLVPLE